MSKPRNLLTSEPSTTTPNTTIIDTPILSDLDHGQIIDTPAEPSMSPAQWGMMVNTTILDGAAFRLTGNPMADSATLLRIGQVASMLANAPASYTYRAWGVLWTPGTTGPRVSQNGETTIGIGSLAHNVRWTTAVGVETRKAIRNAIKTRKAAH